jgi:MFS family permease
MLIGRCIQGSGAGGILTLTEALITDLIPLRQRGNYFALIGIVWALGSVSGMRFNPTVNPHH